MKIGIIREIKENNKNNSFGSLVTMIVDTYDSTKKLINVISITYKDDNFHLNELVGVLIDDATGEIIIKKINSILSNNLIISLYYLLDSEKQKLEEEIITLKNSYFNISDSDNFKTKQNILDLEIKIFKREKIINYLSETLKNRAQLLNLPKYDDEILFYENIQNFCKKALSEDIGYDEWIMFVTIYKLSKKANINNSILDDLAIALLYSQIYDINASKEEKVLSFKVSLINDKKV